MYSASIRGACGFRSGTQSAFSPVQPRTRVNSLKFGSAVTGGSWPRTAGAPEMSSKPVTDQPDCNDDEQDPSAAPPSRMLAGCLQSMGYTYVCDTQATRRCQSPSPPSPSHPPSRMLTGCLQAQGYTYVCDEQAATRSRSPSSQSRTYAVRKVGEAEATMDHQDQLLYYQKTIMQDSMKNSFGTEPSSQLSALTLHHCLKLLGPIHGAQPRSMQTFLTKLMDVSPSQRTYYLHSMSAAQLFDLLTCLASWSAAGRTAFIDMLSVPEQEILVTALCQAQQFLRAGGLESRGLYSFRHHEQREARHGQSGP